MQKDFWSESTVAVLGAGSWGTMLAHLVAPNVRSVRFWVRNEERARSLNATRANPDYFSDVQLAPNVLALSTVERLFEAPIQAVIWALPSDVCRQQAKVLASSFQGDEIILHATKGVEEGTLKRMTEVLEEELPCARVGVISGPNLAAEVAKGQPAATVVASKFPEVIEAGRAILGSERFRVYGAEDVAGVEWAGTLKNIYAIASGICDGLQLGMNTKSMLLTRGLSEMARFGKVMGTEVETFLGLAGVGDLLATCSSVTSRNYRVGQGLARGETLEKILDELGSTAEGVRTTLSVYEFAQKRGIELPIVGAIYMLLKNQINVGDVLKGLLSRPPASGEFY